MSVIYWHKRFLQQAQWTENARAFVIQKIKPAPGCKILEIGSGTGAVLDQFASNLNPVRYGIDLNRDYLKFNSQSQRSINLIQADGLKLPLSNDFFDMTYCHFLLLWISNPLKILEEMKRVTQVGGWICLFAEPDYLARIDSPKVLQDIGKIQNESLDWQGARLDTGRNLVTWLYETGFSHISWGVLGAHESVIQHYVDYDREWTTLESDLMKIISKEQLMKYKENYLKSKNKGGGILFIPTFYAYAQKI